MEVASVGVEAEGVPGVAEADSSSGSLWRARRLGHTASAGMVRDLRLAAEEEAPATSSSSSSSSSSSPAFSPPSPSSSTSSSSLCAALCSARLCLASSLAPTKWGMAASHSMCRSSPRAVLPCAASLEKAAAAAAAPPPTPKAPASCDSTLTAERLAALDLPPPAPPPPASAVSKALHSKPGSGR